jgi:glyoxylase-like metal-dependent hydrolase (beta-lactamase superfamily II)
MLIYEKLVEDIFLVRTDDTFGWTCQGILIKDVSNSGNILIDCNFSRREYRNLLKELNNEITAFIATHAHLDHVGNLHHLEKLKSDVKFYCPIPENEILLDLDKFMDINGARDFGVAEQMKNMLYGFIRFKELKSVMAFKPGTDFKFGGITLKTIHLPGHSPAHIAVIIENSERKQRKILFASDMGLDDFGPWFGFKYNSIKAIKKDVEKIENIYLNDDYILTSGHGSIFFEKQPEIFKEIPKKIEEKENKFLKMLDPQNAKGIEDLAMKGLIYSPRSLENFSKLMTDSKKLITVWEGFFILNMAQDLIEKGKVKEIGVQQWVLN